MKDSGHAFYCRLKAVGVRLQTTNLRILTRLFFIVPEASTTAHGIALGILILKFSRASTIAIELHG